MKKILSIILTVIMTLSLLPQIAFAEAEAELLAVRFGELTLEPAFQSGIKNYRICMTDGEIPEPVFSACNGATASVTAYATKYGEKTEITVVSDDGAASNVYSFEIYVKPVETVTEKSTDAVCMSNGSVRFSTNSVASANVNFLWLNSYKPAPGEEYHANSFWAVFRLDLSKIPEGADNIKITHVADKGLSDSARNHLSTCNWKMGIYSLGGVSDTWVAGNNPATMSVTGKASDIVLTKISETSNKELIRDGKTMYIPADINEYIKAQVKAGKKYVNLGFVVGQTDSALTTSITNVIRPHNFSDVNFRPFVSWESTPSYNDASLKKVEFKNGAIAEQITKDKTEYRIIKSDNNPISGKYITNSPYSTAEVITNNSEVVEVKVTAKSGITKLYKFFIVLPEDAGFSENAPLEIAKNDNGDEIFNVSCDIEGNALKEGGVLFATADVINPSGSAKKVYFVYNYIRNNKTVSRVCKKFIVMPGRYTLADLSALPENTEGMYVVSYIAEENEFIPVSGIKTVNEAVYEFGATDYSVNIYHGENDSVIINGMLDSSGKALGIYVLKNGKKLSDYNGVNYNDVFLYSGAVTTDENGYYGVMVSFVDEAEEKYTVVVTGKDFNEEITFEWSNEESRNSLLDEILKASEISAEALSEKLGLSHENPESEAVAKLLLKVNSQLDENVVSEILRGIILSSENQIDINTFVSMYDNAVILESINKGLVTDISVYAEKLHLDSENIDIYEKLNDTSRLKISSVLMAGKDFRKNSELMPVFKEAVITEAVLTLDDISEVSKIIIDFSDELAAEEDISFFAELSDNKKESVISDLRAKGNVYDFESFGRVFAEIILNVRAMNEAYITAVSFGDYELEPAFSREVFSYKIYMNSSEFIAPSFSVSDGASGEITNYSGMRGEATEITVTSADGENTNTYTFVFDVKRKGGENFKNSASVVDSNGKVILSNDTAEANAFFLYVSGYAASHSNHRINQWGFFKIDVESIPDNAENIKFTVVADNGISDAAKNHMNTGNWVFGLYEAENANDSWKDGTIPSAMVNSGSSEELGLKKLDALTRKNMTVNSGIISLTGKISEAIYAAKESGKKYITIGLTLEDTDAEGNTTNVFRPAHFDTESSRPYVSWVVYPEEEDNSLAGVVFENAFLTEKISPDKTEYTVVKTSSGILTGEFITRSVFADVRVNEATEDFISVTVTAQNGNEKTITFTAVPPSSAGFTEDGSLEILNFETAGKTESGSGVEISAEFKNNSVSPKRIRIISNVISGNKIAERFEFPVYAASGYSDYTANFTLPLSSREQSVISYIAYDDRFIPISEISVLGSAADGYIKSEELLVTYKDAENEIISVNGKRESENAPVGVYILRSGKELADYNGYNASEVFLYAGADTTDEEGHYGFSVSFYGEPAGTYTAYIIDCNGFEEKSFYYAGSDLRCTLLKSIIEAAEESADALKNIMGLSDTPASEIVSKFLLSTAHMTYMNENNLIDILKGFILSEELTENDFALFTVLYNDAVNLENINGGKEANIVKYTDKAGFEADVLKYYNLMNEAEKRAVSSRKVSGKSLRTYTELANVFKEEALLHFAFTYDSNDKVAVMLSEFSDYFEIVSDMQKYNSLNAVKKNNVIKRFRAEAPFDNKEELASAFSDSVSYVCNSEKNQGTTGGGGGGGGAPSGKGPSLNVEISGNTGSSAPTSDDIENQISYKGECKFNDLEGYDWAKEAILELFALGVVNGVAEDKYNPSHSLKREEFVKLSACLYEGTEGEISFKDIDDGAWYIPYIRKAVNSGIIKGISEDEFGTGRALTREDMAVIIVRILKSEKEISYDEKFMDDSEISDYAREAVYLLRTLGIVKGNEDGTFAPKRAVTRAEAAVIISNILNFKKGA